MISEEHTSRLQPHSTVPSEVLWDCQASSSSNTEPFRPPPPSTAEKQLASVRAEFVCRVSESVLNQLLDRLLQINIINDVERECAGAKPRLARAEYVVDTVMRKGPRACAQLLKDFCELDLFLSEYFKLS